MKVKPLTVSAVSLAKLLADPAASKLLQTVWHRTLLWRWATGRLVPSVESAFALADMTRGIVAARGWTVLAAEQPAVAA